MSANNFLFPVFLKLHQLKVLIVGGGYVGWEKLQALLNNSPQTSVKIVALEINAQIRALAGSFPNVELIEGPFEERHLEDVDLALLATDNRKTNRNIRELAKQRNILVNVADTPDLCDFYLGSVVQKGALKIGISTNGQSPTFAKRLKEVLNNTIPEETHDLLGNLRVLRDRLRGDFQFKVKQLNQYTRSLVDDNLP